MKIKAQFAFITSTIYFLLLSIQGQSQNPNIKYDSLYSTILKEHRPIRVILPKKYNQTDRFDVLYVLDGEWNTSLAERVYEFLGYARFIPDNMIIVSVPNYYKDGVNMRERDFTPTSTENKDAKFGWMRSSLNSGGAGNFLLFFKYELIPFINKKYPTKTENNILYGTSLGGLFAIYAYLHEPALFKSYLTVEPSLWWDNGYISKIATTRLKNIKESTNTIWISSRDGEALNEMGISDFDSLLTHNKSDNLYHKVEMYANETHFSVIWKGIYDGLKFTFIKSKTDGALVNKATIPNKFKSVNGSEISFSKMDAFLKSQMDSIGIPGLSFALINNGQIVYHRTLGVTNIETKQQVSNETIFDAASMTKTPFAFLVMRLAEKGVLDLDKPLFTYLPLPDIAHDERYKLITARMVLSHTTGFPNWRFFNKDAKLDIKFMPGTQYQYSGEGFEYLANVVAHLMKIQKNELQGIFNEEVAKPLKMNNVYFTWNNFLAEHRASGHIDGKVAEGYGISDKNPNFYASYSLQTDAINYARFLIGLMTEKGLKKESYDDMLKPQFPDAFKSGKNQQGLGIVINSTEFGNEYSHGGFNLNFTSEFMFNKEQKFGYVFFTNCNKASNLNKKLLGFLKSK